MCGIGLLLSFLEEDHPCQDECEWNTLLSKTLSSRGPDVPRRVCHYKFSGNRDARLTLHGSVLHMRGARPRAQPLLFSLHPSTDARDHCQSYDVEKHDDDAMTEIPASADDCALCWNGECYTYSSTRSLKHGTMVELVAGKNTRPAAINNSYPIQSAEHLSNSLPEHSDTILIKDLLRQSISETRQCTDHHNCSQDVSASEHEAITETMARIHGEYSFLLYVPPPQAPCDYSQGYIYCGRDMLGRRSLLINRSIDGVVALSSVAASFKSQKNQFDGGNVLGEQRDGTSLVGDGWEELPPGVVYRIDVSTGEFTFMAIQRIINNQVELLLSSVTSATINDDSENNAILSSDSITSITTETSIEHAAECLLLLLDKSVQRRVMNAPVPNSRSQVEPSVAVLFSGGIDSVILAALSHRHIPLEKPIDLINVSFYEDSDASLSVISPDRLAALHSYCEMTTKWPERNWRFIAVDVSYREVLDAESKVLQLIHPLDSTMDFNIAVAFWFAGRGRGRVVTQNKEKELVGGMGNRSEMDRKAFSLHEPLLRFAKGKPSMSSSDSRNNSSINKIAATSIMARQRLVCVRDGCSRPAPLYGCVFRACKFCCGKLQSPISKFLGRSAQLCPVHNHGSAVSFPDNNNVEWSACRMFSCEDDPPLRRSAQNDNTMVISTAKILLSGVGADEQMAGYGRHRSTFQRGGYAELNDELRMEVARLWTRNLGRDDRCLSDCGKEGPFSIP
eukprot:CCRYP_018257-RA/>CCRYP_018257-RA protein AED:0.00 eAED:0.00 QI:47/0/0.5/1/0/0.5/2/1384/733